MPTRSKKKGRSAKKRREQKPHSADPENPGQNASKPALPPPAAPTAPASAGCSLLDRGADEARLASLRATFTLLGKEEWWWLMDDSCDEIAEQLNRNFFVVIDGFLLPEQTRELRAAIDAARRAGDMQPGVLAGGATGQNLSYTHERVRGDHVMWQGGDEDGFGALARYMKKMDTLVSELGERPCMREHGLAGVQDRSKAMCTCYPGGGARYTMHCDNHCTVGDGDKCNGRRLTALLYLNDGWTEGDGGQLRLFHPAPRHKEHKAELDPLGGRAVIFWSDYRVPHEVLSAAVPRFAVTLWYYDHAERSRALEADAAPDTEEQRQRHDAELKRVQDEIASFERDLGGKAHSGARVSDFAGHSNAAAKADAEADLNADANADANAEISAGVSAHDNSADADADTGAGAEVGADADADAHADAHADADTHASGADLARDTISSAQPDSSAPAAVLLAMPDGTHERVELVKEDGGDDESGFVCVRFANGTTEFVDSDDISLS